MKLIDYLKDKLIQNLLLLTSILAVFIILFIFKINIYMIILVIFVLICFNVLFIIYEYYKRKSFYDNFKNNLDSLDQKYLITEILKSPNFLEGKILVDALYDIDKSMIENINNYKYSSRDFTEYLEMWCHEIKTPLATANLIVDNNKNEVTDSIKEELCKIDNYIEKALYYSRSGNVEKDYLISKINLTKVIQFVIKKNKKDILNKNIKIEIGKIYDVYSDSKWLEFIINQIITNSIKYSDDNSIISIKMSETKNNKILEIRDSGSGILKEEISRVFDKGFTGSNGRINHKSTGIGLYLCHKLCLKLGHEITIDSKINEYTKVSIIFPNNSLTSKVR